MSAYYDFYETPSPKQEKGKKKTLHARIYPKRTYTKEEFLEHAAVHQHLPKNVLGASLDVFIDDLCDLLADGNIVELGELGFLSTSLKCLRETDDEHKKIRAESVIFQNVHLRISSIFRKRIMRKMKLERIHSPSRKAPKVKSTAEERKSALAAFLKENFCITRREYVSLTTLTPYAAMNELNDFISQEVLRRRGSGRSVVYVAGRKITGETKK